MVNYSELATATKSTRAGWRDNACAEQLMTLLRVHRAKLANAPRAARGTR